MNWYLAKIVFRIICGEGSHTPQFDEQLRLLAAPDEYAAFCKACQVGMQEQHSFPNHSQKLVEWKFVNVTELHSLNEYADGAELTSRIVECYDAANYIEEADKKATSLQTELRAVLN